LQRREETFESVKAQFGKERTAKTSFYGGQSEQKGSELMLDLTVSLFSPHKGNTWNAKPTLIDASGIKYVGQLDGILAEAGFERHHRTNNATELCNGLEAVVSRFFGYRRC
jgi:hypothetical protein